MSYPGDTWIVAFVITPLFIAALGVALGALSAYFARKHRTKRSFRSRIPLLFPGEEIKSMRCNQEAGMSADYGFEKRLRELENKAIVRTIWAHAGKKAVLALPFMAAGICLETSADQPIIIAGFFLILGGATKLI